MLPPLLQSAISNFSIEYLLVLFMIGCSFLLVALFFERVVLLLRVRQSTRSAAKLVTAARIGSIETAMRSIGALNGPARPIFVAGLERATGVVRGDPARAMMREQRRLGGALKARTWILGTAGALMPFVGLFGTVLGVMDSFQAIGESGQGGFAVVSVGISQALIATAVGIAVALEGVVLFNLLNSMAGKLVRDLALLVDELAELIEADGRDRAGHAEE